MTDAPDLRPPDTAARNAPSSAPPSGLLHVDAWIFDLDNTLYPASCNLFAQIDVRMRQFIADALGLPLDDAFTLQKRYYREYGTTLRGLMDAHGVEPEQFLSYVHDIDYSPLAPAPALDRALGALAGRKLIFTNGSTRHAQSVVNRLGIAGHFDGIFDIRAAGYIPKPNVESYRLMIERFGLTANRCAMFEDIARNLAPAAGAGMTTVWVREVGVNRWAGQDSADLSHVHHVTDDLAGWLTAVVAARKGSAVS
ncbi:MAG: pyrimidine 5'-nucleotidase [Telmatospirillum sp.]|nr:pyrimidine 5'-nucleotidase [Telmatospirillum sp.]